MHITDPLSPLGRMDAERCPISFHTGALKRPVGAKSRDRLGFCPTCHCHWWLESDGEVLVCSDEQMLITLRMSVNVLAHAHFVDDMLRYVAIQVLERAALKR